ncbi:MAG: ABC transporter permease subunit [Ezakiella sp.]|uniref:ABC transporter permease n=1 Tax=Ezakiella sp. TaxID=1935205 RepID=UPI00297091A1|nr:ABC transporter permease subunit [Ezakiella sp.]MDD7730887.1 ABC transporter permease subunit [Eubacteriales bacterium]MDY6080375.1 ABC transporter permease subunit [Ezakiella sp.]
MKTNRKRLLGAVALIIIWSAAALIVDDEIILPSFVDVFKKLISMFKTGALLPAILKTASRIMIGVLISIVFGNFLAYISYKFKLKEYLEPLFSILRTIPVISIVLIVLFFAEKNLLSLIVVILVTLPIVYENVHTALTNIDSKKLELAKIYDLKSGTVFRYIELPTIIKSTLMSLRIALGLSFKAGATSEVVSGATGGLGELMYVSKLSFDMPELIAITFVIIILSFIFEMIAGFLYKRSLKIYD